MPFIGNQPALSYTSFAQQTFTIVNSQTAYTLDHSVSNGKDILLYINNVKQIEGSSNAYTASGTTLTLSSALTNGTDTMYCVFIGKAVQTVNPPSGSVGLSQLSATGTKDATTFLRGDNTFASAGGDNTPAFLAKPATAATISDDTLTKVSFTEVVDTDNAYDGSRFTPGVAGYYQVNAIVEVSDGSNGYGARIVIYKNGSADTSIDSVLDGTNFLALTRISVAGVIYLDADDYIEVYASFNTVSGDAALGTEGQFSAYKLIGVS